MGSTRARRARAARLIVTCEHGGNRVPARYRALFEPHQALLESHRGFDAGAARLAHDLARLAPAPARVATVSRLLIDLNRSAHHRARFSPVTRALPAAERAAIEARHWTAHRTAVEADVARGIAEGSAVIHVAVHSFTPVLDGVVRAVDVGLLYDPRRTRERELAQAWKHALARRDPALRVRSNQPYRGVADGLTTHLRRLHADACYAGIELELNQALVREARAFRRVRGVIVAALAEALRGSARAAIRETRRAAR